MSFFSLIMAGTVTNANVFINLASKLFDTNGSEVTCNRKFRAVFGITPDIASYFWNLIKAKVPKYGTEKHLLWALHFLKNYSTEHNNSIIFGCSEKTFRKWCWIFVKLIHGVGYVSFYYSITYVILDSYLTKYILILFEQFI